MILCRYRKGEGSAYGIVEDDTVIELQGTPFGEHKRTTIKHPLSSITLMVPVIPPTFYAGGVNYQRHVIEGSKKYGIEPKLPTSVNIGYRANNALIAHEEPIVKPKDCGPEFQYEGELVAVIGKKARHLSREEALSCILGWTIGNDVSSREWQFKDPSFLRSKNSDTFKPMGPWIVTGLDPKDMLTSIRLNGRTVDSFETGNMLFDVAHHIVEITKYCTLYPGDVIWFGTDGVPENMKPGDTVEVEISGIGTLRNPVVAES